MSLLKLVAAFVFGIGAVLVALDNTDALVWLLGGLAAFSLAEAGADRRL